MTIMNESGVLIGPGDDLLIDFSLDLYMFFLPHASHASHALMIYMLHWLIVLIIRLG